MTIMREYGGIQQLCASRRANSIQLILDKWTTHKKRTILHDIRIHLMQARIQLMHDDLSAF